MTLTNQQRRHLKLIERCPLKLRSNLLKKLPKSAIQAICECCLNVLKGNIALSAKQKSSLKKHKSTIRNLVHKKSSLFTKRKLLIQKGGFLSVLLPAAISAISGLVQAFHR